MVEAVDGVLSVIARCFGEQLARDRSWWLRRLDGCFVILILGNVEF